MKAKKVLKLLQVTRPTLCSYVKKGKIRVTTLINGYYDYNDEDVYKILNKECPRTNAIYARVSTKKQKKDLENQVQSLKDYCATKGITVSKIYEDISSGMTFDRKNFQQLLQDAINHRIQAIFITYPDRLSRISYQMFKELFEEFGVEIHAIYETNDPKTAEKEIFQEIISLMHCFAMKLYSQRRRERLTLAKKQLELEVLDVN